MRLEERNRKIAEGIGGRIERARESKGMSRVELAAAAHRHYDTVLKVERGRGLTLDLLADIATGLGLPLADLVQ